MPLFLHQIILILSEKGINSNDYQLSEPLPIEVHQFEFFTYAEIILSLPEVYYVCLECLMYAEIILCLLEISYVCVKYLLFA